MTNEPRTSEGGKHVWLKGKTRGEAIAELMKSTPNARDLASRAVSFERQYIKEKGHRLDQQRKLEEARGALRNVIHAGDVDHARQLARLALKERDV